LADGVDIDRVYRCPSQNAGAAEDIRHPRRTNFFNRLGVLHRRLPLFRLLPKFFLVIRILALSSANPTSAAQITPRPPSPASMPFSECTRGRVRIHRENQDPSTHPIRPFANQ